LGYKGTQNLDKDTKNLLFEANGAEFQVDVAREYLLYQVDAPQTALEAVSKPLGESLRPKLEEYLVEDEHSIVELESAPFEFDLGEKVHQVAFRHQGLGNSLYLPPTQYHKMEVDLVKFHWAKYFREKNLAVVGVGVDHSVLENVAASQFGALDWEPEQTSKSKYVGGESLFVFDASPTYALGFEAPSLGSGERPAALVLQSLLGGASYPASQVYFEGTAHAKPLNTGRLAAALGGKATTGASYNAYSDSGLFFVHATFESSSEGSAVVASLVAELKAVAQGKVGVEEFARAKSAAKLSALQALESRTGLVRFLGESSLFGSSQTPDQFIKSVNDVTLEDVRKVVQGFLKSNPTVVGLGDIAGGLPTFSEVKEQLSK
jgi:predicted Zn-dependent peptidase